MSWGRRRYRGSSVNRYTNGTYYANRTHAASTPFKESSSCKELTKELAELENACDRIERMLRNKKPLNLDTPTNACRSLRFCLNERSSWIRIRRQFLDAVQSMQSAEVHFSQKTSTAYTSSITLPECREPIQIRLSELRAEHPTAEDYSTFVSLCKRYNDVVRRLDAAYYQTNELIKLEALPKWKEVRHLQAKRKVSSGKEGEKDRTVMFAGIRQAYSALMAMETGKLHRNKPSDHFLFGWCDKLLNYKAHNLYENIREIARLVMQPRVRYVGDHDYIVNDMDEKVPAKLKAPSVKEGYELLTKQTGHALPRHHAAKPGVFNDLAEGRTIEERLQSMQKTHVYINDRSKVIAPVRRLGELALVAHRSNANPSMLSYLHQELRRDDGKALRIRNKICRKIMQLQDGAACYNMVTTVLLASPVHLGGDDYIAPALYQNNNADRSIRSVWGAVLMRRGWPDMFHTSLTSILTNLPSTTQDRIEATIYQYGPDGLTPEAIQHYRARIASSCRHFFEDKHDESLRQLTDKQKKARLLLMLREIPQLTREDSYGVSNCVPGTEQFIIDLSKLQGRMLGDGKAVDGKSIARAWKKSGYIQMYRFSSVITSLYKAVEADKKRRAEIEAALDARIQEAMDWDGFGFAERQSIPVQDSVTRIDIQNSASYVPEVVSEDRINDDGTYSSMQQAILDATALIVHDAGIMEQAADEARESLQGYVSPTLQRAINGDPSGAMTFEEVVDERRKYEQELQRGGGDVRIFG